MFLFSILDKNDFDTNGIFLRILGCYTHRRFCYFHLQSFYGCHVEIVQVNDFRNMALGQCPTFYGFRTISYVWVYYFGPKKEVPNLFL